MSVSRFRIHPGIGVARVGNADVAKDAQSFDGFFIGPETPGVPPNWDFRARRPSSFKLRGKVKRQAARFRVWEYIERAGRMIPHREVTLDHVVNIRWRVEVANTKASFYVFDESRGSSDRFFKSHSRRNVDVPANERTERLEIRPGPMEIEGKFSGPVELVNPTVSIPIPTLGQLRTDDAGRLVFLGGVGAARSSTDAPMDDPYNNSTWFDDVSDGPVNATITFLDSAGERRCVEADGAWVIVGPPDFAPAIVNVVSLYDLMVDLAVRTLKIPEANDLFSEYAPGRGLYRLAALTKAWTKSGRSLPGYRPSYAADILPILSRAASMRWVHDSGYSFHEWVAAEYLNVFGDLPGRADVRHTVLSWLRDPDEGQVRPWLMPRTFADDYGVTPRVASRYLSLTRTQYALMQRWADGEFEPDYHGSDTIPSEPDICPEGLDRAALENCSGGGFCPGMEVGWLIRKPQVYSEPFRIKAGAKVDSLTVGPGFFSQQVALPWHADFWECQKEEDTEAAGVYQAWWPANRPDDVQMAGRDAILEWNRDVDSKDEMVVKWSKRGFVIQTGDGFFEQEGPPG